MQTTFYQDVSPLASLHNINNASSEHVSAKVGFNYWIGFGLWKFWLRGGDVLNNGSSEHVSAIFAVQCEGHDGDWNGKGERSFLRSPWF